MRLGRIVFWPRTQACSDGANHATTAERKPLTRLGDFMWLLRGDAACSRVLYGRTARRGTLRRPRRAAEIERKRGRRGRRCGQQAGISPGVAARGPIPSLRLPPGSLWCGERGRGDAASDIQGGDRLFARVRGGPFWTCFAPWEAGTTGHRGRPKLHRGDARGGPRAGCRASTRPTSIGGPRVRAHARQRRPRKARRTTSSRNARRGGLVGRHDEAHVSPRPASEDSRENSISSLDIARRGRGGGRTASQAHWSQTYGRNWSAGW